MIIAAQTGPLPREKTQRQETNRAEKCYTNTDSISKSNNKNKPTSSITNYIIQ